MYLKPSPITYFPFMKNFISIEKQLLDFFKIKFNKILCAVK